MAIAFMFWKGPEKTSDQKNLMQFVPEDAFMVFEIPNAELLDRRVNGGLVIWEEMQLFPAIAGLDSLLSQLGRALGPQGIIISRHPSGAQKSDWLFTLGTEIPEASLRSFFIHRGFKDEGNSAYNGEEFFRFSKEGQGYFMKVNEQVMHFSSAQLLLEKASRMEGKGLLKDSGFNAILKTKAASSLAFLYINHEVIPDASTEFLKADLAIQEKLGAWSLCDLSVKTNGVQTIGLIQVSDSAGHSLAKYAPYQAVALDNFLEFLPDNSIEYVMRGQSRPNEPEPKPLDLDPSKGYVISRCDGARASFLLYPLVDGPAALDQLKKNLYKDSEFRGLDLFIADPALFDLALIAESGMGEELHIAVVKDMAIITMDIGDLKDILDRILTDRTLAKDSHFQDLLDDVSSNSAYHHYLNLASCEGILERSLVGELPVQFLTDPEQLQKFQALIIQFEPSSKGLFHMNLFLKYNPERKKETSSIWEMDLDTNLVWGPKLVRNHYTSLMEIAVQDASHQLYLISNTGKVLWKKALEGEIRSEVTQVDILRNGKLQMLFNTDNEIHLLDRNGITVTGFPIKLVAKASAQASAMDYEKNRKYRILIGTEDGKILNYNGVGKRVEGWEFVQLKDDQVKGIQEHFTIGNKDYITCMTAKGEVFFLERNGKLRHRASSVISGYDSGEYTIHKGKSIGDTRIRYASKDGSLRELNVGGGDREVKAGIHDLQPWTESAWLAVSGKEVMVMDDRSDGMKFESDLDSMRLQALPKHVLIWDPNMNSAVLLDHTLSPLPGFPIMGRGPAVLSDINGDGSRDLILMNGARTLTMYSFQ
jgi:hypothetical protein